MDFRKTVLKETGIIALGSWVVVVGLVIGFICAVDGFRSSLRIMEQMDKRRGKDQQSKPRRRI